MTSVPFLSSFLHILLFHPDACPLLRPVSGGERFAIQPSVLMPTRPSLRFSPRSSVVSAGCGSPAPQAVAAVRASASGAPGPRSQDLSLRTPVAEPRSAPSVPSCRNAVSRPTPSRGSPRMSSRGLAAASELALEWLSFRSSNSRPPALVAGRRLRLTGSWSGSPRRAKARPLAFRLPRGFSLISLRVGRRSCSGVPSSAHLL